PCLPYPTLFRSLAGQVTAKLFASSTGSDADWIVKLIDVYPEKYPEKWQLSGYELMIADEVFRGRFRNSFEKPEPISPGVVTPFKIDLHTANHVFKKGHRIMVQEIGRASCRERVVRSMEVVYEKDKRAQ